MALTSRVGSRQLVVHLSPETPKNIYPGMTLSEAKSRCADLLDLPAMPAADRRSLEALGHWMMRFSPAISLCPPDAIFLDATGLERLYGGLENVWKQVSCALASMHITASIKIAPTPGAAWALAAFGKSAPNVTTAKQIGPALSSLPPEALRIDPQFASLFSHLGVQTIGALLRLNRDDLAVRFGPSILMRIDQAFGAVYEPLNYLKYRRRIEAKIEFDGAVEALETIHAATAELIRDIAAQLAIAGLGTRELQLIFRQPYTSPIEKIIRLMRPSRDATAMLKLVFCALESLETSEGVLCITITAQDTEPLGDEQIPLLGERQQSDARALDHLIEHLRIRLDRGVAWGELGESNLPEDTGRFRDSAPAATKSLSRAIDLLRPLGLLRQPRAIHVMVRPSESREGHPVLFNDSGIAHCLEYTKGPERITGQWWNGRWKTRDYFDVLDEAGRRFWIFRVAQSGRWFLHGIFE